MQKTVYKRLNENTVLCIDKYKNILGYKYHKISLYYEDTEQTVEFGFYKLNKGMTNKHTIDTYSYNNHYIIGYKYHSEEDWLKIDRLYDIDNRCDLLTDDKFYDYFNCLEIETKISNNKCKHLALGKKFKHTK